MSLALKDTHTSWNMCRIDKLILDIYYESYFIGSFIIGSHLFFYLWSRKNVETYQEEIAPGVIKLTKGKVDTYTPYAVLGGKPASEAMLQLPEGKLPFSLDDIGLKVCDRGCVVEVPLDEDEQLYGFGLQYGTFGQRGLRKRPHCK